jgi:hypothetical protein
MLDLRENRAGYVSHTLRDAVMVAKVHEKQVSMIPGTVNPA